MLKNTDYAKVNRPRGDNFPSRYCFYDCVATYAKSINRNFELCFLSSWEFKYINDPSRDISQNLLLSSDYLKDLKKHHGITIDFYYEEKDNRSLLLDLMFKNLFIILKIDAYYLPWDLSYKKDHLPHYAIAVKIDPVTKELIVTDPYYDQANVSLGVLNEAIGMIEGIITAGCTAAPKLKPAEALIFNIKKRFELVDGKNSFQMIEAFANDISVLVDRQFQLHASSVIDIGSDKLKSILIDIYERRQDFFVLLEFSLRTLTQVKNNHAKYFLGKMLDIINRWNIVQLIYVKAVISNNSSLTATLKDRILFLAEAERLLSQELIEFWGS